MKKLYMKFLFAAILCMLVILTGCSASSSSIRYNKNDKPGKEGDSPAKFTSEPQVLPEEQADSLFSEEYAEEDDSEEFPDDEAAIDLSEVMNRLGSNNADPSADQSSRQEQILMEIIKYLNTPYKYGGNTKDGIDCSAFTQAIYYNTLSIPLLRTARDQYNMGITIENREELQFGDLVFFNTRRRVRPGHVGIYIGDNLFAHASSKHGVIVSSLDHEYYSKRYMGGRRIEGKLNARL